MQKRTLGATGRYRRICESQGWGGGREFQNFKEEKKDPSVFQNNLLLQEVKLEDESLGHFESRTRIELLFLTSSKKGQEHQPIKETSARKQK